LQNEPVTCYQRKLVELGSGHMKGVEIVKSSSATRVQSHGFNAGFDRCGQDLVRPFPKARLVTPAEATDQLTTLPPSSSDMSRAMR